ncbi:AAA family ATPase [Desulfobacter postgatei]|uniref:MoxR-like ATPase n=1 Tax=Desulfobacter postgatei 2ac9 TaxID=879212 RepID=I5B2G7_9BACT|nr:MoxR family ATPase [Desulfobacter postgatei]EIM63680.1 MoxR-like ATPase [Desulfobacter postgatei 2ac9]
MTHKITLDSFPTEDAVNLYPCKGWPKAAIHHFDRKQAVAVLAALAVSRPLLVRGEPGCGKTQLARAVAQLFAMPLACLVVNERTEPEDLLWRYDALRKLSDANAGERCVKDESQYLSAGPLWWALNHTSAESRIGSRPCRPVTTDESGQKREFQNGVVLLIDEIDKADRSVPNSLLEPLGNLSFEVPYTGERVERPKGEPDPLIIITTNREQELPQAFVRRCLVLDLVLDDDNRDDFIDILSKRGQSLFQGRMPGDYGETTYEKVADLLYEKRMRAKHEGLSFIPGQAEYLDHLEALIGMKQTAPSLGLDEAMELLAALTFMKNGA